MKVALEPLGGTPGAPRLVLGPSLGTSAAQLWGAVVGELGGDFEVLGWNLPGHGGAPPADGPFTVADVAAAVAAGLAGLDQPVHYAGDSFGGAVGLQLLLDQPSVVATATLCCTGARIGDANGWAERAALVRADGTAAVVDGSRQRWFAPGFSSARPDVAGPLLAQLAEVDDESYASACEALAGYDVRDRLGEVAAPVLAVAGGHDVVTSPAILREIAVGVRDGQLVVLDAASHLAPAEDPARVAALIIRHALRPRAEAGVRAAGMAVRRAVLGDEHVERAIANTDDVTREFQSFITQYAWGSIWTRPGLARRERSLITLTALVALGHDEELAMHLRAARRIGLSNDEIKEALLQMAVYCGVPAANTAFRIAQRVLAEFEEDS
ncbi:4-carboxymuconolactone decarboxylase [uncultured Jatrophihabitans sp.]|uniref:bifunctional 3-oxoadipate enol-lactonase/4-carboxymuconolactone decarboxylase PcaDC n=1 Tax=uncultured Jatrophihabitans sp. TaxID=1610747 RepID=UPI0035CC8718